MRRQHRQRHRAEHRVRRPAQHQHQHRPAGPVVAVATHHQEVGTDRAGKRQQDFASVGRRCVISVQRRLDAVKVEAVHDVEIVSVGLRGVAHRLQHVNAACDFASPEGPP